MNKFLLGTLLLVFSHLSVFSQGCSDAGFCTMGAMRPNQGFTKKINFTVKSIEVSQYFGMTSFYLKILAYNADINIGITKRLSAQVKLPYQFVFGGLGNTQGVGDVSLSATYNAFYTEKMQLNLSIGAKIPTGDANLSKRTADRNGVEADRPLPMYYQSTLGTYDAIGGISLISKNWLFATGIQIDLTNTPNKFLWGAWNKTADSAKAQQYPKSRDLRRGIDVMLRVERNLRFANWNIYGGLLGIWRITNDTFIDADGIRKEVKTMDKWDNPNRLVLTLLVGGGYRFNTRSSIKLTLGARLLGRSSIQVFKGTPFEMERNPDGLSRILVTSIGYEYRF